MRLHLNLIVGCRGCGRHGWHEMYCDRWQPTPTWLARISARRTERKLRKVLRNPRWGCLFCGIGHRFTAEEYHEHLRTVHPLTRGWK